MRIVPSLPIFAAIAALLVPAAGFATTETFDSGLYRADAFRETVRDDLTFQPVTHRVELRFGMSYNSETGLEPGYGARYTVTFNQQFDNGWQVGVSLGVSLDNLNTRAPWRDRGLGRF
ncbi:hypothetical protein [Pararhodobacter sp.]|uniref:hypothetical protein n=1 Tax=Pararhodobacter sp. TaxID=2127056 RepID=UPI002FDD723F